MEVVGIIAFTDTSTGVDTFIKDINVELEVILGPVRLPRESVS